MRGPRLLSNAPGGGLARCPSFLAVHLLAVGSPSPCTGDGPFVASTLQRVMARAGGRGRDIPMAQLDRCRFGQSRWGGGMNAFRGFGATPSHHHGSPYYARARTLLAPSIAHPSWVVWYEVRVPVQYGTVRGTVRSANVVRCCSMVQFFFVGNCLPV